MDTSKTIKSLAAGAVFLFAAGNAQAVVMGWGTATSNAIWTYCPSFCSTERGTVDFNEDRSENGTSASSSLAINGGVSEASAMLDGSGAISTPTLRGYGSAAEGTGFIDPGGGAFATAFGAQGYTYSGGTQTISLDLTLSAILDETIDGSEASASARAAVIFANDLDFFPSFGTLVSEIANSDDVADRTAMFANIDAGSRLLVTVRDSLTFEVNDGDEFLVVAQLEIDAERGGEVDARNTFGMDFLDSLGNLITDPLVLSPEGPGGDVLPGPDPDPDPDPAPVPAPATLWLLGPGLIAMVGLRRRKTGVAR